MTDLPVQLLWLADAPLFIDEKQVEAFYDAVLQPGYEEIGKSQKLSDSSEKTIGGKLNAGIVFPGLFNFGAGGGGSRKKGKEKEEGTTWNRVSNPYRHLLALVLRYAVHEDLEPRLIFADDQGCENASEKPVDLGNKEFIEESPRAMIMLDLPPGTKFIPLALELNTGKVARVYEDLASRLRHPDGTALPTYPHGPGREAEQMLYWEWFEKAFEKQVAVEAVEDAVVQEASVAWIDYRFPLAGRFPHLHLDAHGRYATGVFAYQLISRGFEHGLRIVGTLKSEPDINVLAIFER